jgi:hypothetical protein
MSPTMSIAIADDDLLSIKPPSPPHQKCIFQPKDIKWYPYFSAMYLM